MSRAKLEHVQTAAVHELSEITSKAAKAAMEIHSQFRMVNRSGPLMEHHKGEVWLHALDQYRNWLAETAIRILHPVSDVEQTEMITAVAGMFESSLPEFRRRMAAMNPKGGKELETRIALADSRLRSELALNMTGPEKPTSQIINSGSHATIVAGDGNVVNSHNNPAMAELATALGQLLVMIDQQRQAGRADLDDAREAIEAAKAEAEKPNGKPGLIKTILVGVKPTFDTINAGLAAWENAKNAARGAGLDIL
jgi:hypothetical protein